MRKTYAPIIVYSALLILMEFLHAVEISQSNEPHSRFVLCDKYSKGENRAYVISPETS